MDVLNNDPDKTIVLRDCVFGLAELTDKIFSYLDPASVKAVSQVSK